MHINFKRTLCSLIFASLVTTQVSGMLSHISQEKKALTTIKKTTSRNNSQVISIEEKKKSKTVFSLDPIKTKVKDLTLSLLKKKKNQRNEDEEESEDTKKKKTNRKNKIKAVAGAGLAVGFLVDNRKKFFPQINATTLPVGWGDLTPIITEATKPENKGILEGLRSLARPEIIAPVFPLLANPASATYIIGTGLFTAIAYWLSGKKETKNPMSIALPKEDNGPLYTYGFDTPGMQEGVQILTGVIKKINGKDVIIPLPKPQTDLLITGVGSTVLNPMPEGPKLPDLRNVKTEGILPIALLDNPTNPIDKDGLLKPLTEEQLEAVKDLFTLENLVTVSGIIAKEIAIAAAIRLISKTGSSIWNISDRWTKESANNLLGIKPPVKKEDPKEWRIQKYWRIGGEYVDSGVNGVVDAGSFVKQCVWDGVIKCQLLRGRSQDECVDMHPSLQFQRIKNRYSRTLAKIENIDDQMKYIAEHKDIDEPTKKASLEILQITKMIKIQAEKDFKSINLINSYNIPQEEKDLLIEQIRNRKN